ncbi:hypothetical protein COT23_02410 [Candidatus Kaiserbacteria bacterium CG08_land_8_20_14_0_20_50_21]|uniref:Uncharacterized protein n=1 Tax=Candidatus Kaiserbacteria bacterium CG08_land_8_20_14_0_20_50_21 TaxID=1974604 RepID=A0A2H0YXN4_9BACT|nr:MAG: hypothetical protein COT23_02410 [Candidatus Kaiserbacteria bacterium CG08_land_8_20_14_0_20_50_21]
METYFVSVGVPEVTVEIMSQREARQCDLYEIPVTEGGLMFLGPDDVFVTRTRNCPIVIAAAGAEILVADVKSTIAVGAVTRVIIDALERKAPYNNIEACMLFGNTMVEYAFLNCVCRVGIRNAWTMFPGLAREEGLIAVRLS